VFECRNGKKSGKKVTSIDYLAHKKEYTRMCSSQYLVSTNDSRIRLLTIKDNNVSITTKYKGHINKESQIAASLSYDEKFIICGSDDGGIYIWNKVVDESSIFSLRKSGHSKMRAYEVLRIAKSKKTSTTVAIFAPQRVINYVQQLRKSKNFFDTTKINYVILAADTEGSFKVLVNYDRKPKELE